MIDTAFHSLLPPGGHFVLKMRSRGGMTKDDIEELQSGSAYIVVIGKFNYEDIYDTPHWIKYCNPEFVGSGMYPASAECVNSNETDNN